MQFISSFRPSALSLLFAILACARLFANEAPILKTSLSIPPKTEISYGDATLLGLVEGLTEYVPVSSTGHLIICNALLGLDRPDPLINKAGEIIRQPNQTAYTLADAAYAYTIVIQIGAIAAIIVLYWKDLVQILLGCLGKSPKGRQLASNLLIAFLPAAVLGLLLDQHIEAFLGNNINAICGALIAGAVLMLWVERYRKRRTATTGIQNNNSIETLSMKKAFFIGCLQCLAMWPGTSRSMATITGGYLVGLQPAAAAKFSFLLGLITLTAASSYKMLTDGASILSGLELGPLITGIVVAFIASTIAIKWFVAFISRYGMNVFAGYRIVLACGLLIYFN